MSDIKHILAQRATTHGAFVDVADTAQLIKSVVGNNNGKLSHVQREGLDMIISKLARIAVGNADEVDHWDDIAGYALLVSKDLTKNQRGD